MTGGPTDVINGQALCPKCNLQKGASEMSLREWQKEFKEQFIKAIDSGATNFLLVATPGAGKTRAANDEAKRLLADGIAKRVVVVTHTEYLKYQWARAAAQTGFSLDPNWYATGPEVHPYKGTVVTYQSILSQWQIHRHLCSRSPTFVIFDEVHHMGDVRAWGDKAKKAFDPARFRLSLSGTPFRSDDIQIQFVNYEPDPDDPKLRRARADYTFSYEQAMRAGICRKVFFPTYDGKLEWIGRNGESAAMLTDKIRRDLESERLRTFLNPEGDAMRRLCGLADNCLSECRRFGHHDAGGLIIASGIPQAQAMAKLIKSVSGEAPAIVVSRNEDDEAGAVQSQKIIDQFRDSDRRWIVAVRMISEGVDISRLRVLVYATDYQTEMFFRQAVGRVVRMVHGLKEQHAHVFIPDIPALRRFALEIKKEVDHILTEEEKGKREGGSGGDDHDPLIFIPLSSTAIESDVIGDHVHDSAAMDFARQMRDRVQVEVPVAVVAELFACARTATGETGGGAAPAPRPVFEEFKQVRRENENMARRRDILLRLEPGATNIEYRRMGGESAKQATLDELRAKNVWLKRELARIAAG
jgi:superfamily II DNA or RNA helicase